MFGGINVRRWAQFASLNYTDTISVGGVSKTTCPDAKSQMRSGAGIVEHRRLACGMRSARLGGIVQSIASVTDRSFRGFIASMLMGIVLLLNAMAVSPGLHEYFHADAGAREHQCAVTLFAQGQMDSVAVDVPPVACVALVWTVPAVDFSVFSPVIENLPGGRAPPDSSVQA